MDKYALNIDTKILKKRISYLNNFNNNYNFLNNINLDNYVVYYDILNNLEDFKLKNIYNYIFNILEKINYENNLPKLNGCENINPIQLNKYLNEYIKNDLLKSIIIMNTIQQYYYPIK
jgi:hypothetical protein